MARQSSGKKCYKKSTKGGMREENGKIEFIVIKH
jgi:hypothetical protein